jgi:Arc/MetJ-type ribon-helix-helix transcriptional regulator
MLKTVRVPEKSSEQYTVLVGRETAEKLEKQTYSDAIKYLLGHHIVFPSELISHIEELIKNNELGYSSKEEFLFEAVRQLLKYYCEDIESIKVHRHLYEKAKTSIEDLDLPFISVDDFVEEQLKKLHEQHDQWKEQKEENKKIDQID